MNRYSSYKDSGVEWIGNIPKGWDVVSLKRLGELYGGLTGKSGDDFRSEDNPNNKPYIPYTNISNNTYISKNHFHQVVVNEDENQNRVEKYDLFFLMSSETYEDLGKPCILIDDVDELYLNSFCKGFRITQKDIFPLFLNYQLLGDIHKKMISVEGQGFTRINLRQDRLKELPIFLPPLNEQHQIVSYLDNKTSSIDSLIQSKEKKIELLKEKRTSLINQVVTKGLNPDVEMKDSGVEWIGEIPREWIVSKPKYESLIPVKYGMNISSDNYQDEGIRFIRITDITEEGELLEQNGKYLSPDLVPTEFQLDKYDVLFCRSGHTVGKSYLHLQEDLHTSGGYLVRFNFGSHIQSKFIFYITKTQFYWDWIKLNTVVSTIENVNGEKYSNMEYPLPPLSEQQEIVEFLDKETKLIDETISSEQKKIELLKEYKQSLISEVVTGKRKVTTDE